MPNTSHDSLQKPIPVARLALILAALIAVAAVGIAVWKGRSPAIPPSPAAQAPGGDISTVIAKLEARLKATPNDSQGWQMLGLAFYQTGKYAESAQAYARATQIEPGKAEFWSALGEARVLGGPGDKMPADAKSAFEKTVALDPKDPRARYFLGVALDMEGNHKSAVDAWLALLADTPPGAPWEADVRRVISQVGAKEKIEVASRLAAVKQVSATGGVAVATAGIPGPTRDQMQNATQLPKGQQDAMIDGMVNGLEAKLKTNPANENGWIMLMRSRVQLGQTAKASEALKNARAAFANDSQAKGRIEAAANALGMPL